ncbi:hypothetical protein [Desulfosarcina cetonica]|uniref:hypothetical protein n=1 Tax=Desulfosarcina cetonica TaxID=90730 RepID=UPI001FEEF774|nr:hypothetical protein [Desulfosarcina cetonica]
MLQGVSPGAALVFLMAGPATNATSLTVLARVLGRRATMIYLTSIAVCAVAFGLLVDQIYNTLGISPQAVLGQAGETLPFGLELVAAMAILVLSIKPVFHHLRRWLPRLGATKPATQDRPSLPTAPPDHCAGGTCGCKQSHL